MAVDRPLSHPRPQRAGAGCMIAFGAIFALAGCAVFTLIFVLPLVQVLQARSWHATPCTILDSRVGVSRGEDGLMYRVEVRYQYQVQRQVELERQAPPLIGDRYDFSGGSYSSPSDRTDAIVAALPPGTQTTCWYDPDEPAEAVLDRSLTPLIGRGVMSLLFPAMGAVFIGIGIHLYRSKARTVETPLSRLGGPNPSPRPESPEPLHLHPGSSRRSKMLILLLFAIIWNGITWTIIAVAVVPGLRSGSIDWMATIFLGLFALIGAGLVAAVVYQILALANPRLALVLDHGDLHPGDSVTITWECLGDARRLRHLRLDLEGSEEATYQRGTSTSTDRRIFATLPIAATDDHRQMLAGRAILHLPATLMPTFLATNNKIIWRLRVRGDIPRWPDVDDTYDITVMPTPRAQA